jgi:hypothetical protein
MSTEEPKPESAAHSDAKVEPSPTSVGATSAGATGSPPANVDAGVAWPPPEAAPSGNEANAGNAAPASDVAPTDGASQAAAPASSPTPADSGVMTAPPQPATKPPASGDDMPAATPGQEMGLSDSTLHWLEDGDQAVPGHLTEPGTMPSYDPRAPVPGRRRAVLVTGLAGLVAVLIAAFLYAQAEKRRAAAPPAPAVVEPARDLTTRAEAALAGNKPEEALELAHLALVADPRFADAHFVVATVAQSRNQGTEARDEFRKYLELAPLGTHAAAARSALSSLPP